MGNGIKSSTVRAYMAGIISLMKVPFESGATILGDKIPNGGDTITDDMGEITEGQGQYAPAFLSRQAAVKNPGFTVMVYRLLKDEATAFGKGSQVLEQHLLIMQQPYPISLKPFVRFDHYREFQATSGHHVQCPQ